MPKRNLVVTTVFVFVSHLRQIIELDPQNFGKVINGGVAISVGGGWKKYEKLIIGVGELFCTQE